jgi:hypothetical protein
VANSSFEVMSKYAIADTTLTHVSILGSLPSGKRISRRTRTLTEDVL